ncbi:ABC transporter ATP-binding protein [Streptococcus sciuri]|uniref:ABC transporter ATP-binding protein n=1 Tax=Streptococcus sciuri TaxID=2973939 RepID=A0ABT2F7T9_9STRE|nr:ABC transporter ATP-binding protein [Streptococcus sciuri]MCS4488437.1 ABC transporter ATP-binding protein [Streptococcus sciuri]
MSILLEWKNFSFQYQSQSEKTLIDINLTIKKGAKVLIVGASGSGKSTLGNLINGLIPNSYQGIKTGEFTIAQKDAYSPSIYDKSLLVSTVLQDPDGQFIGLSVAEDIAFALENDNVEREEMIKQVKEWAERLQLTTLLDKRPQDLSGGQKQRVSLAGVLVDESPVLLFDEPLANLDPKSGQDIIDLIDRLHRDQKATTIIIEHRLEDVLYRQVDQIVVMDEGRIVFDGRPDDLLKTEILEQHGIREPLYITALRHLGYSFEGEKPLSHLERLDLQQVHFSEPYVKTKPTTSKEKVLSAKNLQFSYDDNHPILKNISFELYKGEKIAIVGKNGAGKSTLAKCLCQFVIPSGNLYFGEEEVSADSVKQRSERIGYILQNPNQMISQTMIFDEVALGLRLRGIGEKEVLERVEETLKVCGLYPFRKWPISALSFGQKKRVTIASILVLNPEVILLDEPTAGQDMRHYEEMMSFLETLSQKGHTIIMITHDMQLMLEYADRTLVIADGELLADCTPIELFSNDIVLAKAYLKKTSLYQLAEKIGADSRALTKAYIAKKEDVRD